MNRETEFFTTLFAVTGGGIGVVWTIWALFGGEYEGSVPIFGMAIAGVLIGGLVGAGIDWMVNGVSALARKPARNPPPPQRPPSGPPDLDAPTVSRNPPNRPTGVLECSGCGKEVSEEAQFCPHCGERFEDPPCANPDCDAIPSEGERFCSKCGWPIQTQPAARKSEAHPKDAERDSDPPSQTLWWIGVALAWALALLFTIDRSGIIHGEAFSAFLDQLPWNWDW